MKKLLSNKTTALILIIVGVIILSCIALTDVLIKKNSEIKPTPTITITATATIRPTMEPAKQVQPTIKAQPTTPKYPAGATAKCKDGTYSYSKTASGTCSGHKGVDFWINKP